MTPAARTPRPTARPADMPPPGAPREWAHMSWRARARWVQQKARDDAAAAAAAPPSPSPAPKPRRRPPPTRDLAPQRRWTLEELRAGNAAYQRAKRGGPEPSPEEIAAARAYKRAQWASLVASRAAGVAPRRHTLAEVVATVEAALGRGERPGDIAAALGIYLRSAREAMRRAGRDDLAERLYASPARGHPQDGADSPTSTTER